ALSRRVRLTSCSTIIFTSSRKVTFGASRERCGPWSDRRAAHRYPSAENSGARSRRGATRSRPSCPKRALDKIAQAARLPGGDDLVAGLFCCSSISHIASIVAGKAAIAPGFEISLTELFLNL